MITYHVDSSHQFIHAVYKPLRDGKPFNIQLMKKGSRSCCLVIALVIMFSGCTEPYYSTLSTVSPTVTFQSFYDDLLPYGIWIDYPGYGQVWHPRTDDDFRPYATNGHWTYSNEGWVWVSGYNWGWGPFHYGRWMYDDLYGWLWVPGYEWSPAWVTWGNVDDYYAWAPLMPEVNVSLHFNLWKPHTLYWNLCPRKYIYDHDLHKKIERPDHVRDFTNRVSIINNFNTTRTHKQYYSKGPGVTEAEKYSDRKIEAVNLKTVRKVTPVPDARVDDRKVFRPTIPEEPKPREYKRVENEKINPIRSNEQKPAIQKVEQNRNIEKLPVYKNNIPPQKNAEPVKKAPDQQWRPAIKNRES